MKIISIIFSFLIITLAAINSFKGLALANSQSEGATPQSGDLCGGTGGNGEIFSMGNNTFTLKLNSGGNLIVNLTNQAMIETPTGYASASDLKIGDRVTLIGDNNRDGTFTADAVVVCNGTQEVDNQEEETSQATPIFVRNNDSHHKKVSGATTTVMIFLVGLIWLSLVAFLKLKKKKSFVYLIFFTLFYIYFFKVLDYTLIQFQSLLLLKNFMPNLILQGQSAGRGINLIPLVTLTPQDLKTSLLNILLFVPFGFGLPFITDFHMKKIVVFGAIFSIVIEFLQLVTGLIANITFRVADINDVIFNTVGVAIGYILIVGFVRINRHLFHTRRFFGSDLGRK